MAGPAFNKFHGRGGRGRGGNGGGHSGGRGRGRGRGRGHTGSNKVELKMEQDGTKEGGRLEDAKVGSLAVGCSRLASRQGRPD